MIFGKKDKKIINNTKNGDYKMARNKNIPEEILDDDVSDFIGAASAAKAAGKKKFKFGGKEYPVTISDKVAKAVNKESSVVGIPRRKDAESIAVGKEKMGDAKKEELTSDARRKAFREKLVKLGYKKQTQEERLLEKMGKSSTGYDLYHDDFSSAMKHAYEFAKRKLGVDVDPEEIDDKVAMGPRKPSKGKTNRYRLLGKDGKKAIQVQVYNMDGKKYELNMYKEDDFKPHMMYDPKTGKAYKAEKPEDHERMSKMGYTHEKPKMNEATGGMKMIGAAGELEKYAKKSGGIDKKDFMKAVKLMRTGMSDRLVDFTNDLDTEPREKIIDVIANYLGVKATEKMFRVKFLNRKEEIELDEGKMKKVVMDIDNVTKGMMKNKMMKPFADKFKKDAMKSMNIRKSLEKILPDYVAGKDIQKLMASHCMGEEFIIISEAYKPVKSGHYDVKVTVSDKDVSDVKDYIMNSRQYNDGDIEDVDSDQVDGGGMKFKGTGDIFIQGDGAGKLGMEIAKKFRSKVKVLGEEINEASKEGTIRIINLGDRRQDKIRKELGVDGLPNKGFQVQRMTKGKFVNQGKPYKSQKDAEKVRKDGQHSMQFEKNDERIDLSLFEVKMSPKQISQLKKAYGSLRGKKISPEMGMKLSKELEKLDKDAAIQIAKADIPFVSTLAVNKLMMNFNMSGAAIRKALGEELSIEVKEQIEVQELIENSDKKDAEEMKEIVLAMNPKYNTKQIQKEVEKMAIEKYGNKSRAKKIASHIK